MFRNVINIRAKLAQLVGSPENIINIVLFISLFALLFSACSAAPAAESSSSMEDQETDAIDVQESKAEAIGPQILFSSQRDGNSEIFVMNADGSDQHPLTDSDTIGFGAESDDPEWRMAFLQATHPTWSPDNQQIAFGVVGEIFAMNADGSNFRQLTDGEGVSLDPHWSPDGQHITFISNEGGDREIWVINADGTDLKQLTDNRDQDNSPDWSPDGQTIAFHGGFPITVYLLNVETGESRPLIDDKDGYGWEAAWSPDGQQIAFVSSRDGDDEIFVVNIDGSDLRQITEHDAKDTSPAWSADGRQIVFSSDRDGDLEIYVMNVDGSDVRQLTDNDVADEAPAWSSGS